MYSTATNLCLCKAIPFLTPSIHALRYIDSDFVLSWDFKIAERCCLRSCPGYKHFSTQCCETFKNASKSQMIGRYMYSRECGNNSKSATPGPIIFEIETLIPINHPVYRKETFQEASSNIIMSNTKQNVLFKSVI